MATNTDDETEIHRCFRTLKDIAAAHGMSDKILSYGMSDDFLMAIADGSNMVRIGSKIFGERVY